MKLGTLVFSCLLLVQQAEGHCGILHKLPEKDIKELVAKADAGDADAAYRLWSYHSISSGEEEAGKWLNRAAELGEPEAQRWLAYMIVEHGAPHQTFGKTAQDAVFKLLSNASKKSGTAAHDFGEAYYEGYFGQAEKDVKARQSFLLAALLHNSSSWESLATLLHKGEGGDPDQVEAYYYICLATQCTHPGSEGGKGLWRLRHDIEKKISLAQATEIWSRVDVYISTERKRSGGNIYPPPLLGSAIPEDKWNEWLKTTDEFEVKERLGLMKTKGE